MKQQSMKPTRSCRTRASVCVLTLVLAGMSAVAQEFLGKFIPAEVAALHRFGESVAILGDLAVAGARQEGRSAQNANQAYGGAYIFRRVGDEWRIEQRIVSPNRPAREAIEFGELFGQDVAITRIGDVEFVIVSAPLGGSGYGLLLGTGAVYIFRKVPGGWDAVQTLQEPSLDGDLAFYGFQIAVSGNLLAVGAPNADFVSDGITHINTGAIFLYRYNGSSWVLEQGPIFAPTPEQGFQFGDALSVHSNEADEFLVSRHHTAQAGTFTGSAFVYQPLEGEWMLTQSITRPESLAGDLFGAPVINGNKLLIGAQGRDDADPGNAACNSGAAYMYRFDGAAWSGEQVLERPDIPACGDLFGQGGGALAIHGDMLAAARLGTPGNPRSGLYLYRFDGTSWVTPLQPLWGPDTVISDGFGVVAIDGECMIVGAPNNDERDADAGAVYFYRVFNTPAAPGLPVTVNPADAATGEAPATLTFTEITSPGTTTIQILEEGPEPPAGFQFQGQPVYYEISTTAEFDGPITVCLSYAGLDVDPATLELLHFENGEWVGTCPNQEDPTTCVNAEAQTVCGVVSSLSPFIIVQREPVLAVEIDIKPGSYPNSINLGSHGVVPVAIFSTATFDARQVDPMTVTLADAGVRVKGKGTPQASFEDVNGDGLLDLVMHVETEGLNLTAADTRAVLRGNTFDGTRIRGTDTVRVVQ